MTNINKLVNMMEDYLTERQDYGYEWEMMSRFEFDKALGNLARNIDENKTHVGIVNDGEAINFGELNRGSNYAFVIDEDGELTAYRSSNMEHMLKMISKEKSPNINTEREQNGK